MRLWFVCLIFMAACAPPERADPRVTTQGDLLERGLVLYHEECARCHGEQGLGDGRQANFLYPKPRDFALANFRVTSTESGPTEEDLARVIRRGLPGSAMPPFGHLPGDDQAALSLAVRHLAIEGKVRGLADEASSSMTPAEARDIAGRLLDAGPPIELPPRPADSELSVIRGEELYQKMCTSCHAWQGGISLKRDMKDDTGAFIYPRNFETGLFMRGTSDSDIALTIIRGLPGTPMPSYVMPPEDLWALVDYVRSLAEHGEDVTSPDMPGVDRVITLTGVADPGVWTEDTVAVGYRGPAAVEPARIVLREGEEVLLELKSADATHSFYSPELGIGPVEIYPGHSRTIRFKAPAPGEYEYFCMVLCGHCHFSMKGTLRVVADGVEPPAEDMPAHCAPVEELFEAPAATSVIEKGKALYRKMACGECHGEQGRGGIENFNALPAGEVPALDHLVESLMVWSPERNEVQALLDSLEEGLSVFELVDDPPFVNFESFLRRYESISQTLREGRVTPPKDPSGPSPPLQMPAWEARLSAGEMDALVAYLVSLYDWAEPNPVQQVVAFNHQLHIEDVGYECVDCHQQVTEASAAGIPTNDACFDCHDPEETIDEMTSPALASLTRYLQQDTEIPWKRVNRLPEHTTFSHARHVGAGNLDCAACHGDMSQLATPPERPAYKLTMAWCLDCHQQEEATDDCRACHLSH